jgi:hypothetical protein
MKNERYVVVDMGSSITTFARVGQTSNEIQLNKRHINRLSQNEIKALIVWCEIKSKDHNANDSDVDKIVFEICKKKRIEKSFFNVMVRQGRFVTTSLDAYKSRVEEIKKMLKQKK